MPESSQIRHKMIQFDFNIPVYITLDVKILPQNYDLLEFSYFEEQYKYF